MNEKNKNIVKILKTVENMENIFRVNNILTKLLLDKIKKLAKEVSDKYREEKQSKIKIMNFCGTHEWTVTHFGLRSLMPENIELVAGPGCPVCVTPSNYIEETIKLALDGIVIYTYGDVYKLKSVKTVKNISSLSEAKASGASVKIVTSLLDAINDAKKHRKNSVFIGIGFETVASGYAKLLLSKIPDNLSFMSLVKLTPPAMIYTIEVNKEETPVKGIIAPGHVSTIIGAKAWNYVSEKLGIPVVVSGFEPLDVLISIAEVLKQLVENKARTVVEYSRAVTFEGDKTAQKMINEVFEIVDDVWRGIGFIPRSGLRLRDKFKTCDAFAQYGLKDIKLGEWVYDLIPGCRCADIILGKALPSQCPLFLKTCTPVNPVGPCMVSLEGSCAIWARFGEGGIAKDIARNLGLIK